MRTLKLVGCRTYTYFPRKLQITDDKVVMVEDSIADVLLADTTDQGMPYFVEIQQEKPAQKTAKKKAPARKKAPAKVEEPEPAVEESEEDPADDSTEGAVSL